MNHLLFCALTYPQSLQTTGFQFESSRWKEYHEVLYYTSYITNKNTSSHMTLHSHCEVHCAHYTWHYRNLHYYLLLLLITDDIQCVCVFVCVSVCAHACVPACMDVCVVNVVVGLFLTVSGFRFFGLCIIPCLHFRVMGSLLQLGKKRTKKRKKEHIPLSSHRNPSALTKDRTDRRKGGCHQAVLQGRLGWRSLGSPAHIPTTLIPLSFQPQAFFTLPACCDITLVQEVQHVCGIRPVTPCACSSSGLGLALPSGGSWRPCCAFFSRRLRVRVVVVNSPFPGGGGWLLVAASVESWGGGLRFSATCWSVFLWRCWLLFFLVIVGRWKQNQKWDRECWGSKNT